MCEEMGWRRRSMALAALGAAAMGRAAFAWRFPGDPSPLQMQVLAYIATHDVGDSGRGADEGGVALALRIDEEVVRELLRALAAKDLVVYHEWDENEGADDAESLEEFAPEGPDLALTALGWAQVDRWLHCVQPMFGGWPPDRPDVDDAVG